MSVEINEDPYFGEVISSYTRAEALADGVLIDAGPMAKEAGFRWPVAITAAAWADCVEWEAVDNRRQTHQDRSGRLWDVLFMAAYAVRTNHEIQAELRFKLYRVPRDGRSTKARLTELKLIAGAGDEGEPVLTICLPTED